MPMRRRMALRWDEHKRHIGKMLTYEQAKRNLYFYTFLAGGCLTVALLWFFEGNWAAGLGWLVATIMSVMAGMWSVMAVVGLETAKEMRRFIMEELDDGDNDD